MVFRPVPRRIGSGCGQSRPRGQAGLLADYADVTTRRRSTRGPGSRTSVRSKCKHGSRSRRHHPQRRGYRAADVRRRLLGGPSHVRTRNAPGLVQHARSRAGCARARTGTRTARAIAECASRIAGSIAHTSRQSETGLEIRQAGTRPTALRKQIGRLLEYFGSDPKAESFCPIARAGNFEMHQRCEEVASLLLRREFGASTQRCAAPCQCTEAIVKVSRSLVARARSDRARGQQGHVRPIGAAEAATQDRRRRPAGHGRVDPDQVAASPCAGQPAGCRCGAATDRDRRGFP